METSHKISAILEAVQKLAQAYFVLAYLLLITYCLQLRTSLEKSDYAKCHLVPKYEPLELQGPMSVHQKEKNYFLNA